MADDPNRTLANWEVREFMRTTTDFRKQLERERESFRMAVEAIPEIKRMINRQEVALFAQDDKNEFGMIGVIPTMREIVIAIGLVRKLIPYFWPIVLSLVAMGGTIIGMLYKLVPRSALFG